MADPKDLRPASETSQPSAAESPEMVGGQSLYPIEKGDLAYSLNIANLTLRSKLGSGAHGSVYVAEHHILKKLVAVKVLHLQTGTDSSWAARFQREAQAMSRLNHPNIAKIFSYSVADEKQAVLVMELIEGSSLHDFIKDNGVPSAEEVRRIFLALLDAMGYAHDLGIIHRDIKPGNIMISNGEPKILDFGVAKFDTDGGAQQKLTATGQVIGTPAFMSPEQCRGQAADARADIYSLACVLYYTLTGRALFSGNDGEILIAHASHAPVLSSNLSVDLQKILEKALAKDPGQRFQSCREFGKALESADLITTAARSGRHKLLIMSVMSACLIAAIGFAAYLVFRQPSEPVRTELANAAPRGSFDNEFRKAEESIKREFQEGKLSSMSLKQLEEWTMQVAGLSFENRIVALGYLLRNAESQGQITIALSYADKMANELKAHEQKMHDKQLSPSPRLLTSVEMLCDLYRSNDQFEKASEQVRLLKLLIDRCAKSKSEEQGDLSVHTHWYYQSATRLAAATKNTQEKLSLERDACRYFLANAHNGFFCHFYVQLIRDLISTNQLREARVAFDNWVSQSLEFSSRDRADLLDGLHSIASELVRARKPNEAIQWLQSARVEIEAKAPLSGNERNQLVLTFIDVRACMGVDDTRNISNDDLKRLRPYVLTLVKDAIEVKGEKKHARRLDDVLLSARELSYFLALRKDKNTYSFLNGYFELLRKSNELTTAVISNQAYVLRPTHFLFTSEEVANLMNLFLRSLSAENKPKFKDRRELEIPYILIAHFNWFLREQDATYTHSSREFRFGESCWQSIRERKDIDATEKLNVLYEVVQLYNYDAGGLKNVLNGYISDFFAICKQDGSCNSKDSKLDLKRKESLQHFLTLLQVFHFLKKHFGTAADLFHYDDEFLRIVSAQDYFGSDQIQLFALHFWFQALSGTPKLSSADSLNKYADELNKLAHSYKDTRNGRVPQAVGYCCYCLHAFGQDEKGFEFVSSIYRDHKTWADDNPGIDAFLLSAKIVCFNPRFGDLSQIRDEYLVVLKSAVPATLGSNSHHEACISAISKALAKFESSKAALKFLNEVEASITERNLAPAVLVPFCKSQRKKLT